MGKFEEIRSARESCEVAGPLSASALTHSRELYCDVKYSSLYSNSFLDRLLVCVLSGSSLSRCGLSRGRLSSFLGGGSLLGLLGRGGLSGGSGLNGLVFNLLGSDTSELLELLGDSLFLADGVLESSGLLLLFELLDSDFLLLHLVNRLDEDGLVLELVTLGSEVEVVIDVLGDLLGLSILSEESSEDSLSSHP